MACAGRHCTCHVSPLRHGDILQFAVALTFFPSAPVLALLLFCWALQIQCCMQIIINRIYVVVEKKNTARKVKWGTACLITAINIAVFCIWIPAHMTPPVNHT